ncbi:hypothetical protein CC86DRAFT_413106 [Ophiobolus disseminans]|uniref:Uncharacterized protein n=1 Tax=Ophiobolus disseminans TaxID=1469910 RepID=A0A6A6ZE63_9PLEO|nr:hypothetical protein CC86DRAFT_413106 [Ophiobolus disseminans]
MVKHLPVDGHPAGPDGKCTPPPTFSGLPYRGSQTPAPGPSATLKAKPKATPPVAQPSSVDVVGESPPFLPVAPLQSIVPLPASPSPAAAPLAASPLAASPRLAVYPPAISPPVVSPPVVSPPVVSPPAASPPAASPLAALPPVALSPVVSPPLQVSPLVISPLVAAPPAASPPADLNTPVAALSKPKPLPDLAKPVAKQEAGAGTEAVDERE